MVGSMPPLHERLIFQDLAPCFFAVLERLVFATYAAEGVGQRREAVAFGVGETEPPTAELGFPDSRVTLQG